MDDVRIIELYFGRDESAISATEEKYGRYCTSIAKNILGNAEDAAECVNSTYLHTWNSIPPKRPQNLATFLGKITRNISLNRYKKNTADKRGAGELPAVLDELSELISGRSDTETEIIAKELMGAINAFLGALSPKQRGIFVRRYWHTESIAQIADRFGMKESAVTMTLTRVRKGLKEYLIKGGFML